MDVTTEELTALLDREQIRDCIARLARGEDRRDAGLIGGSFWPDAAVDLGMFAGTFDEYLAWVVPGSPAIPVTQHVLGQTVIQHTGGTAAVEPTSRPITGCPEKTAIATPSSAAATSTG
jgi:hypothetical protein